MRSRLLAKGIAVIVFGAFVVGLICDNSAHAAGGGWAGISNVPVSTNPPDAESTGGSGDGFSWIYYQSTGVATGDITFGSTYDFIYNSASYPATISGTCSTKNNGVNGGFWHYGLNDQARLGKEWNGETFYYFGQFTNSGHAGYTPMRYTTGENGWGHMITIPYGYYDRAEKTKGNLNHAIYDSAGLIKLYEAKMSNLTNDTNILMPDGKTYSMLEMFNISYSYMDDEGEEGTDTEIPRGTYAFCFYGRIENDFLGESIASASSSDGSSGSTTTGIVGMGSQTDAENVVVTAKKDDTVTIEFRHNMYSTLYNRRAYWLIDRPNTSGFNVVSSELARANRGTDRFGTPKENNYYTPRTGNSVLTDKYTIKFTEKGSYTFCEDLKIDRSYNAVESVDYASKACVTVNVDGGGSSGGGGDLSDVCEKFKPSSFNDGYSSVVSKIKNERFGGWEDLIYAKPTDRIQWLNCYYPGAQLNHNATITISHGPTSGSSCPTNNKPFSSAYSFTNQYEVKTDSPFGMNNNSWSKNESYISNTFKPFSLDLGATNAYKKEAQNNYVAERDKVGNTYTDTIKISAGVPIYTKVWEDKHEWKYTVPKTCWSAYPVSVPDGKGGTTIDWVPYPYDCSYEETTSHPVYEYEYSASTLPNEPSDIATVKIPYNFENEVSFSMSGQNADGVGQVVYAGEVVNVGSFVLNVKPRTNTVTEANYATIVRDAQVKLIAYVTEDNSGVVPFSNGNCSGGNYIECNIAQEYSGSLNFNSNYANKKDTLNGTNYSGSVEGVSFVGDYKVFDAKAGTQFCMAVAVYPANSGDPKNMEAKGNGEWAVSSPQCIVVAKKPSFQIWGNGVYSVNGIDALASEKHNVYGVYNETSPLVSGGVVFGSWVEQSIIVRNGTVTKVASGAAMGKDNSGNQINYGWKGNIKNDFCSGMVPLTFTNCIGNSIEAGKSGIDPPTTNVSALVDYWGDGDATGFYDGASLNGAVGRAVVSATGKDIRILETDADIRIGFSQIDANKTRIVKAHDVTIDDVIQYTDGSYTALSALPKVIIYAKNNITIGCNVGRVDAVLIAGGTVYSCGNYQGTGTVFGADENSARSYQLIINGAVIANNIELGRTYGNSFGIGSGGYINPTTPGSETPAEILNYDASILLWGESMASAENSNTLTVTYQHELAPRY